MSEKSRHRARGRLGSLRHSARLWRRVNNLVLGEQFAYGSIQAIQLYAGVSEDWVLPGRLPHGPILALPEQRAQLYGTAVAGGTSSGYLYGPLFRFGLREYTQFAGNAGEVEALRRGGCRKIVPIGTAWAYLLEVHRRQPNLVEGYRAPASRERCLVFPTHTALGGFVVPEEYFSTLADRLEESNLLSRYDTSVCLYWADALRPGVVARLEHRGIRITTAGFLSGEILGDPFLGDSHRFLLNLLQLILQHDLVVVDGPGSPLLYAASLNKPISILSREESEADVDWFNYDILDDSHSALNRNSYLEQAFLLKALTAPVGTPTREDVLSILLGREYLLSPDELRSLLVPKTWSAVIV